MNNHTYHKTYHVLHCNHMYNYIHCLRSFNITLIISINLLKLFEPQEDRQISWQHRTWKQGKFKLENFGKYCKSFWTNLDFSNTLVQKIYMIRWLYYIYFVILILLKRVQIRHSCLNVVRLRSMSNNVEVKMHNFYLYNLASIGYIYVSHFFSRLIIKLWNWRRNSDRISALGVITKATEWKRWLTYCIMLFAIYLPCHAMPCHVCI